MCDPLTAGLLLTAGGKTADFFNNQAALRRQDRQAAEGIRRQGVIQREANQQVGEQIADIGRSTGEAERAEALEGFLNALRVAEDSTTGALPAVPSANPRFAERVEAGKTDLRSQGTEKAGRLARIDAPRFQRIGEASRIGRTVSDLGEQARRSRAEDFLTQLRVASERPNEIIGALSAVAQGVGSGVALGQGGGLLDLFRRGPNLKKLADAGTLIDPAASAGGVFA